MDNGWVQKPSDNSNLLRRDQALDTILNSHGELMQLLLEYNVEGKDPDEVILYIGDPNGDLFGQDGEFDGIDNEVHGVKNIVTELEKEDIPIPDVIREIYDRRVINHIDKNPIKGGKQRTYKRKSRKHKRKLRKHKRKSRKHKKT
jgi:hypothetical protein